MFSGLSTQGPAIVASSEGGMDIEKVAANNPDAIIKEGIDIKVGERLQTELEI